MYSGRFFRSADGPLATFVRELDESIASAFPEFADGSAAARVVLRPDQLTGQGAALADGVRFRRPTAVGFYFGDVAEDVPLGEFVLVLPHFRRSMRSYHPTIDAERLCRSPEPPPPQRGHVQPLLPRRHGARPPSSGRRLRTPMRRRIRSPRPAQRKSAGVGL
jgi:hypothetical protein